MKRRDFISTSALATAGIGSLLTTSCNSNSTKKAEPVTSAPSPKDFELNEETISSLQEKMVAGKYNSEQITNLYLSRIAEIDKKGPYLNSVIEINPDAVAIARSMDE